MDVPKTKCYKINIQQPLFVYVLIFLMITAIFLVMGLLVVGIILGAIVSFSFLVYQKSNNPGIIRHYFHYVNTPNHLSGNKYFIHENSEIESKEDFQHISLSFKRSRGEKNGI